MSSEVMLQLCQEKVAKLVRFDRLLNFPGRLVLDEQGVIDLNGAFIGIEYRLGDACHLDVLVFEPLYSNLGFLGQDCRAIPEIEEEKTTTA